MKPLAWILAAVMCGSTAGLAVGSLSVLLVHASDAWFRGWPWPQFDSKLLHLLLITSIPAALNGGLGAGLAAALGRRQWLDVTWIPIGIHIIATIMATSDFPYLFLGYQLVALVFTVIVWPTGRLGQLIGFAFHRIRGVTGAGNSTVISAE